MLSVRAGAPRATRKPMDSGKAKTRPTQTRSGSTPPTQNTDCQPNAGMIQDARRPPTKPPSGKPAHSRATMTARSRRGEYSEVRLIKLGMAPPRPRPARNRKTRSTSKLGANAVATVKMPNQAVAPISTALRPIRSANRPRPKAPSASPAKAALNTGPSDRWRNVQVGRDPRRSKPDRLQIHAVEQGNQRAQDDDANLKRADRARVNEFGDVERRPRRHVAFPPQVQATIAYFVRLASGDCRFVRH